MTNSFSLTSLLKETQLLEASILIDKEQKYDEAITILEKEIESDSDNSCAFLLIAVAYHWKKDFDVALAYYRNATNLSPEFRLFIVPLLSDLENWNEIIEIAEPAVKKGNNSPEILGSLLNAYWNTNRKDDIEGLVDNMLNANYEEQWKRCYNNYNLAAYYLKLDQFQVAKAYLKKIVGTDLLKYVQTDPQFEKLFFDPEFQEITGTK